MKQVVPLAQTLASQGRLAGIFYNECHVLDVRLENSFRDFEGHHTFFANLTKGVANVITPVVFLTATLMEPEAVMLACGLPPLFDESYFVSPLRKNLDIQLMHLPDGTTSLSSHRIIMQHAVAAIKRHAPNTRVLIFVMFKWEIQLVVASIKKSFPGADFNAVATQCKHGRSQNLCGDTPPGRTVVTYHREERTDLSDIGDDTIIIATSALQTGDR